jgi:uncharacterized membrane protein
MTFTDTIETVGKAVDAVGVATIVGGVAVAAAMTLRDSRDTPAADRYRTFRQRLGRAILLGLELLVAADIIRTVAVTPTFTSAGVLGLIVVIRTFLSFSLEVELQGRLPWQSKQAAGPTPVLEPAPSPLERGRPDRAANALDERGHATRAAPGSRAVERDDHGPAARSPG